MLTLGYKASAEQFGPRELLEFACTRSRTASTASSSATTSSRGATPTATPRIRFAWLGAAGRADRAGHDRHQRRDARRSATTRRSSPRRSGRSAASPTGPGHPRRRHRRVAQRGAARASSGPTTRSASPGCKEAMRADAAALAEEFVDASTASTTRPGTPRSTTAREDPCRSMDRGGRPGGGAVRRAGRRRLHLHVAARAWSSTPRSCCRPFAEGAEKAGRDLDEHREDDRDEGLVRPRPRAGDARTRRIWAALALPGEEKMGVEDPREMERLAAELPIEQAASRWLVSNDPDEHVEQIRPYIELGLHATWSSTPRAATRPASSTPTRETSCPDSANAGSRGHAIAFATVSRRRRSPRRCRPTMGSRRCRRSPACRGPRCVASRRPARSR